MAFTILVTTNILVAGLALDECTLTIALAKNKLSIGIRDMGTNSMIRRYCAQRVANVSIILAPTEQASI